MRPIDSHNTRTLVPSNREYLKARSEKRKVNRSGKAKRSADSKPRIDRHPRPKDTSKAPRRNAQQPSPAVNLSGTVLSPPQSEAMEEPTSGAVRNGDCHQDSYQATPNFTEAPIPDTRYSYDTMSEQTETDREVELSADSYQRYILDNADRTLSHSASSAAARASLSLNSIEDFLEGDPTKYMPSQAQLVIFRTSISHQVDNAVCTLLRETHTDHYRSPNIYESLANSNKASDFLVLCTRIYGVESKADLLSRIIGDFASLPPLKTFLRTMIAAAVTD